MAAWLRREGVPPTQLGAELARRFPSVSPQQLGKVVGQYRRVEPIYAAFDNALDWDKIDRVNIPRDPNLQAAYRFFVDVHFYDNAGQRMTTRAVIVDAGRNLTRGELQEAAEVLATQLFDQPRDAYSRAIDFDQVGAMVVSTILITRRT